MAITYHVVIPFARDHEGNLVPLEPAEAPNAESARRRAKAAATKHAGALAFSRAGDPNTGEFDEAKLTASFGDVDPTLLGE
ncbi:MAG: hypothetical protein ACRYGP_19545 [Janthinobacterium lividum]